MQAFCTSQTVFDSFPSVLLSRQSLVKNLFVVNSKGRNKTHLEKQSEVSYLPHKVYAKNSIPHHFPLVKASWNLIYVPFRLRNQQEICPVQTVDRKRKEREHTWLTLVFPACYLLLLFLFHFLPALLLHVSFPFLFFLRALVYLIHLPVDFSILFDKNVRSREALNVNSWKQCLGKQRVLSH